MNYIGNALSLGMLDFVQPGTSATMTIEALCSEESAAWVRETNPVSCIGHADTALLVSSLLGIDIPMQRINTSLKVGDRLLVAQYNGPRLPEGSMSLPEGAKLRWMLVQVT